jgi:hypothetical protein
MDVDLRQSQTEFARQFNLTLEQYLKIVRSCTTPEVIILLELMKAKNPKHAFRRYCQQKVRRWLDVPNIIGRPLADHELKSLIPKYPITWSLPK